MNCFENALTDFWHKKIEVKFPVRSNLGDEILYEASYFYRDYNEMPELEKLALEACEGNVLDIGAGVGCHTGILQEKGFEVDALEISEALCGVMKERGIRRVVNDDLFVFRNSKPYSTILLLMNGIGIAGAIEKLPAFFEKLKNLLAIGGKVILDSADINWLYEEAQPKLVEEYYGEIEYLVSYQGRFDQPFPWLFIDFETLSKMALENGFSSKKIAEGENHAYLAELSLVR